MAKTTNKSKRYAHTVASMAPALAAALLTLALPNSARAQANISGEARAWHRVTLTFTGPQSSETASPNPFVDYRLRCTFKRGATTYVVPGFFAADGDAANSSATSGNKWRCHFMPDASGTWTYSASFRSGSNVAIAASASAGSATSFDGASGSFNVSATNKTGRDHRGKGRLDYVGKHHLQFAGSKGYFIKGGADSPENFLAYYEFDGTPTNKHKYQPHAGDYKSGDPTFKGGKGKNIIGAINYLASKGMNSIYFLTMNVNGDGKDVWPWTNSGERQRFDVSKLAQWEVVFSHMDKSGVALHVLTQETENDQLLDGGNLGNQRKLYYRELIARFAHHPALVWNLGEENTNTDAQRKAFAKFFADSDPYRHPIVVHTFPGQYNQVYTPLLGDNNFDGPSLQMGNMKSTHAETIKWIDRSAANNRPWFVSLDEIGPANTGVATDANDAAHDDVRRYALWGNLMAGGAGVEWYFGYQQPHDDLDCEDWRSRDKMWDLTRHALTFFQAHLPFWEMKHADNLTTRSDDYVLAKAGSVYAVYLPDTTANTTLQLPQGSFTVKWYDPRAGGALQDGTVKTVSASGGAISIGKAPNSTGKDWVALVRGQGSGPLPDSGTPPADAGPAPDSATAQLAVTSLTLIDADSDAVIASFDPLRNGATLNFAFLPTRNLNVRANTSGGAASVVFALDGQSNYRTESAAPYALEGDTNGNYNAWTPALGQHTLTATPYSASGGAGSKGSALTITFTVNDNAAQPDTAVPDGTVDAGTSGDSGSTPGVDSGTTPANDAALADSAGGAAGDGSTTRAEDGGCAISGASRGRGMPCALLFVAALLLLRRRRRRRRSAHSEREQR